MAVRRCLADAETKDDSDTGGVGYNLKGIIMWSDSALRRAFSRRAVPRRSGDRDHGARDMND